MQETRNADETINTIQVQLPGKSSIKIDRNINAQVVQVQAPAYRAPVAYKQQQPVY